MEDRMKRRGLLIEEIMAVIKYPDAINKRHGKLFIRKRLVRGTVEVCCERIENNIKILTVYWI